MIPVFPVALRLAGRPVLVVGGGEVAAAKVQRLLPCQPRLTVVSPSLCAPLQAVRQSGALTWVERRFEPGDVIGQFMVVAATGADGADPAVFAACEAHHVVCTSVDIPELSSAWWMAQQSANPVLLAVSTQSAAPGLAGRIAQEALNALPKDLAVLVARYGELRRWLMQHRLAGSAEVGLRGEVLRRLAAQPWSRFRQPLAAQQQWLEQALDDGQRRARSGASDDADTPS